ncbi:MAG: cache domain-containing protein [Litorilituus sp.]|jgi:two-component system NarL family sensor kinase|nr:cache domain-containing protein [Litorilituus sp.]
MFFPKQLFFIAIVQVFLTCFVIFIFISQEYRELSEQSLVTLEKFLIEQKKQELVNYTTLAVSAISPTYNKTDIPLAQAKQNVAQMIDNMLYAGKDGYFFAYDNKGNGISHPKEPFRVGKNWWELESSNGDKIIQILIANAQKGGDFYRYTWSKPSVNKPLDKIGYSVYLKDWDWMLGTGVYLDDVNNQLNKLQQSIDSHIYKTQKIILFIAILSIFTLFTFGLILNLSQKKKSDLKINELSQRIIDMQEEERRRISRELHDGIVQILVSIKYSLEATDLYLMQCKQSKPQPLVDSQANLDGAIKEIRRISHHLHPRILDELGLSSALETLAVEFHQHTGIQVSVKKPAVRKLLSDEINITLYRVVQESLTNIEKHSHATQVNIGILIEKKGLKLTIADNGQGFNAKVQANIKQCGIGLRNLAERVEYHNGTFECTSSGKGTKIVVNIPKLHFHSQKAKIIEDIA